jgi:putative oxidoreductase
MTTLSNGRPTTTLAPFSALVLRLAIGTHLIHGTQDNVLSWTRMLEFRDFLASQGFPIPLVCAVISVAAQFVAGICYVIGWHVRTAAVIMLVNFAVALLAVHWGHPYPALFPALMMWTGSLSLLFSGAGAWSVEAKLRRRAGDAKPCIEISA